MKKLKVVGLYNEGNPSPRIEYRIIRGDEDVTDKYDLFAPLTKLLSDLPKT